MKTKINEIVCEILFRIYLKLQRFETRKKTEQRYYDHLGLIDTLGFSAENGCLTRSYSDELTYQYAIKLPFGYEIEVTQMDDMYISIKKSMN